MKTICMLSCLHDLYDDRIYWKEAVSLKKYGYEVIHMGITQNSCDYLSEEGIRLIGITKKQYFKNIYLNKLFEILTLRPTIYSKLLQTANRLKADVYHFHDLQINRIGAKVKKLDHNPKVIYDVHEPYPQGIMHRHNYKFLFRIIRYTYGAYIKKWQFQKAKNYDLIIATEENVANHFRNAIDTRVEIIYNYCNFPQPALSKTVIKKYDAIYSGGLSIHRGAWTIARAVKEAKLKDPKIKVLLLGNIKDKGLKSKLKSYIAEHDLEGNLIIAPRVPYNQVAEYYSQSRTGLTVFQDVIVYHILMPIKTFEYLCFGLPIITSNIGHTGRIVKNHNCGTCIEPGNHSQLADALLKYKNDQTLYSAQSAQAKIIFDQYYRWEYMEKKLIDIYNTLLN